MKQSRFLLFGSLVLIVFLFVIGCQKNQTAQTSHETNTFQQTISELKRTFDSAGYDKKLTERYLTDMAVSWDPNWDSASQAVMGKQLVYYYVPLTPKILQTKNGKLNSSLNLIGYRKYLLIRKTDTSTEFTKALYISDSLRSKTVTDQAFFRSFTGTMNVESLNKGAFFKYHYSLGNSAGPKTVIPQGWVTQCQTLYICQWGALCGGDLNNYYSTVTESYDGCMSPTDGPICDGEYLIYQLVNTTTQQDCQQVWVDDPPPPPGGGGSDNVTVQNVTDNLKNPCLEAIKNKVTDANVKSFITDLFNKTYISYGNSMNVEFDEDATLKYANGNPQASQSTAIISQNLWKVTLNPNFAASSSQEFMAGALIHELVHSFIFVYQAYNPANKDFSDPGTHAAMLQDWINRESSLLQSTYNMPSADATAVALEAISDILVNDNLTPIAAMDKFVQDHYGTTISAAHGIASQYEDGQKGTRCP